jgi:alcohol dehydrogenase class IV
MNATGDELHFQHVTPAFRTFCGAEALAALPRELARLGVERAVLVCGASMVRERAALAKVESAIGARLAGRFDEVREHSPVPTVEAARDRLAELRADGVIALGGGSAVVTARAATILLAEGGPLRALATRRADDGRFISPRLGAAKAPQWVVPSTPTTATAKAGGAVHDPSTGERLALFDPRSRAQGVFLDPDVATTSPVALVRSSALNAFVMAVDALQTDVDPLAEALLMQSLRLLARWLPRLAAATSDPQPRLQLMVAALLSGHGSDHAAGSLTQALSHALGPRSSVANGLIEAALVPHTMAFNAAVAGHRLDRVRTALDPGAAANGDIADPVRAGVAPVLTAAGAAGRLRDLGIGRDRFGDSADHALDDWSSGRAPRAADRGELVRLLEAAW